VVAGYGRGGEEEVAPVEGGEKRRSPSGVRSRVEEVAGGTWQHTAQWHRPNVVAVRRPEEGETPGGLVLGRKAAVASANFRKFQGKLRRAAKATGLN
jgi:hypothetical protein